MRNLISNYCLALAVVIVCLQSAIAGTDIWFNPLTQSSAVAPPNHVNELNSPWQTPPGITQVNLTSMDEIEADVLQSVQRSNNSGRNASMWDMIAYDKTGNYLFIPHETPWGAGVSRYDILRDINELIFAGDGEGEMCQDFVPEEPRDPTKNCPYWANDYAAFDPCRWTPNGTLFLAEEWSGLGRVVEILNPFAKVDEIQYRVLESIANVAHEGINFSKQNDRVIYYIDEWNSGSIYKFVMETPGDYTKGQTFVLRVNAFDGNPADLWNDASNENAIRTGRARWKAITNKNGKPKPGITDPFRDGPTNDPRDNVDTRGGRIAADDAGGTPYGRPEDMEVGTLANGNEVLYIAITSENAVYSVEIIDDFRAHVRVFASRDTPKNVDYAATTGILNSPDNLAQDALGNIYVIEDAPNNSDVGGDIWFARDVDNDGVAESLDHFLSIQVDGSEATGMIFNPKIPTEFVVAVQHPDSTDLSNVPEGFGDAAWLFDVTDIVPPPCPEGFEEFGLDENGKRVVKTCNKRSGTNFVKKLEKAGKKWHRRRW